MEKRNSGYVLLFLMLIIGSIALYLSYNLSLKKINAQSWQVAKTATEFSYWFDIEKNYETDSSITKATALNGITMATLISTGHYLPYGMKRAPGVPGSITAVSEFQCSSLPGVTQADNLSDSGVSGSTDYTCPTQNGAQQTPICGAFNEKAFFSCAPSATAPTNTSAPTTAQYYINANHIALGTNNDSYNNNAPIGLGLIVRTPGAASGSVSLGTSGARGQLPNGSFAQSLISTLPSSSYNVYSTGNTNVQGIGIASYLSNPSSSTTVVPNTRYSKIIDMGLVQAVDLKTLTGSTGLIATNNPPCYGWDSSGNKIGTSGSYTGTSTGIPTVNKGVVGSFPPTCIRIDMNKYGPTGSDPCLRLDLFFTMYRQYLQNDANITALTPGYDAVSSRYYSNTDAVITTSAAGNNFLDVYLGQSIQDLGPQPNPPIPFPYKYSYSTNGPVPTADTQAEEYNWMIYFVRCTRANT